MTPRPGSQIRQIDVTHIYIYSFDYECSEVRENCKTLFNKNVFLYLMMVLKRIPCNTFVRESGDNIYTYYAFKENAFILHHAQNCYFPWVFAVVLFGFFWGFFL